MFKAITNKKWTTLLLSIVLLTGILIIFGNGNNSKISKNKKILSTPNSFPLSINTPQNKTTMFNEDLGTWYRVKNFHGCVDKCEKEKFTLPHTLVLYITWIDKYGEENTSADGWETVYPFVLTTYFNDLKEKVNNDSSGKLYTINFNAWFNFFIPEYLVYAIEK